MRSDVIRGDALRHTDWKCDPETFLLNDQLLNPALEKQLSLLATGGGGNASFEEAGGMRFQDGGGMGGPGVVGGAGGG